MSQYVREWVMTIVFLVAASAFFEGIFPGGSMGKYLKVPDDRVGEYAVSRLIQSYLEVRDGLLF